MGQGSDKYRHRRGKLPGTPRGETPVDPGQPDPEQVIEGEAEAPKEHPSKEKASRAGAAKGKGRTGSSRKTAPNNTRRLIIGAAIALVAVVLVGVVIFLATRGGGPAPAAPGGATPTEQVAPTGVAGEGATAAPAAVSSDGATLAFDLIIGQTIELEVPGTGRFSLRGVDHTGLEIIQGETITPVVADQPLIVNGVTVGRVVGGGTSSIRALIEAQPTQFFIPAPSAPYSVILTQGENQRAFELGRSEDGSMILRWISQQAGSEGQARQDTFQAGESIDFTLNGVPVLNTSTSSDGKAIISLGS